ncbi:hypothetical protein ACFWN2_05755 [Lentzea sp. NPDC058436]|uniref:hypothetical protein n=1 Tax=Lentzea sp. NPDC058436 TaxID=3346499 RepID=UPI0036484522
MRVEDTWARLAERLRSDAPRLHSALLPARIAITGLPPDLAAWWRVFGGVDHGALGDESPLLPQFWHPIDVREAVRGRTDDRITVAVDCYEPNELLFVDLRDGRVFSDEMTEWPSVGAMLANVLQLFEQGRDSTHRLLRYEDGHIGWD